MVKPNFRIRILKEIQEINEHGGQDNLYACLENPEDINSLKVLVIGPEDSPYEGCFLLFHVQFPDNYPFGPPRVKFLTPNYHINCRIHPNLYAEGKVCLSILNTWGEQEWVPVYSLEKIFLTIQGLLDNNPITHEPGRETIRANSPEGRNYYLVALYRSLSVGVLGMRSHPDLPRAFHSIIEEYIRTKGHVVYPKLVEMLADYDGQTVSCFHGSETISYFQLKKDLAEL